jgi:hypothetical protein
MYTSEFNISLAHTLENNLPICVTKRNQVINIQEQNILYDAGIYSSQFIHDIYVYQIHGILIPNSSKINIIPVKDQLNLESTLR